MVQGVTNERTQIRPEEIQPPPKQPAQPVASSPTSDDSYSVMETLGSGPRANPTPITAADKRDMVNADPRTIQLRDQINASFREGPIDDFPANGTLDQAKKFVKENPLQGDDPNAWTHKQREAFNVIAQDFGTRHSPHHEKWHQENGLGGTEGPGSGEKFLQFHRDMMKQFTAETGLPVPSGWDPSTPVPSEFKDPAGKRVSSDPKVSLPGWLTADGAGTAQGNQDFGQTVKIDGKEYKNLNDFKSPDQLGRALGESGYHGSVHSRMGGTMATFKSSKDPTFYAWHGHIDGLVDRWLQTDSGKEWAKANPTSPLLGTSGGR